MLLFALALRVCSMSLSHFREILMRCGTSLHALVVDTFVRWRRHVGFTFQKRFNALFIALLKLSVFNCLKFQGVVSIFGRNFAVSSGPKKTVNFCFVVEASEMPVLSRIYVSQFCQEIDCYSLGRPFFVVRITGVFSARSSSRWRRFRCVALT